MWQQRTCYEQSNVLDVTIQCQLNVSAKNVTEFSTMYGHPSYPQQPAARSMTGSYYQPPAPATAVSYQPAFSDSDTCAPMADVHAGTSKRYEQDYDTYCDYESAKYGLHCASGYLNSVSPANNVNASDCLYYASCMNDSGYGSPGNVQYRNIPSAFSPCGQTQQVRTPSPCTRGDSRDARQLCRTQYSPTSSPDELSEETKIAMREKDVMQRLFSLRAADVEGANSVEHYYQSQTAVIDLERHNVLCQMAYDRKSSESIHVYYNRKLQSLLECVEEKLSALESGKHHGGKRQTTTQVEKKSRLLPKHAVKLMETWYSENLENPYPSRETTLTMAAEGSITVEQIRKWFANKRNRSRNSRLKASDLGADECA
ncbi:uncharacterized protein LOC128229838 [Mya arenaria]|uniref:uncharacterized protein LOC128229838 n=1 Tax=Mya arenaria TaxID=6604 RepID=UPI0022DFC951|nr:uncharacterized protein LOC128229838 [Mya arenaria]